MTDDESRLDRILTPHEMQIRAADRRQRHAHHGFTNACAWPFDLFNADVVDSVKNCRSHLFHGYLIENVYSSTLRSRSALAMTDTELKLIAALAIIGLSRSPNTG